MRLTEKQKRIARWVGYPLLALVTFIMAFSYTFPYQRLKGKIVEVLSEKYDVSIANIEPTIIPGGMVLETVMLKTRPKSPDEKPVVVVLQEVELDIGLFAAVFGTVDLDVVATLAGGTIEADIEYSSSGLVASVETDMLPLANIPGVAQAVGLPMAGALNAEFDLELPGMKWEDAEGAIKLDCVGCTVGDGKAKLKMQPKGRRRSRRASIFASEGLTVPRLSLGTAVAEVEIEEGVGTIKTFTARSNDGFLEITGEVVFADPFDRSTFPGCMAFKLSDELKKRETTFGGIEAMLPPRARQDDGSFAIPTKGKLTALRWDVRKECKNVADLGGDDDTKRSRPSIPANRPEPEDRADPVLDRGTVESGDRRIETDGPETEAEVTESESEADDEPELEGPGNSGPPIRTIPPDDVGGKSDEGEGEGEARGEGGEDEGDLDRAERDGEAPEDLEERERGFEGEGEGFEDEGGALPEEGEADFEEPSGDF